MSLAQARSKAADNRAAVAEGRDPLAEKHAPAMPSFREAAYTVHEANMPRWRNARHVAAWIQTLERHAMPTLGSMPLDRIDRACVLRVLTPIWTTRFERHRALMQLWADYVTSLPEGVPEQENLIEGSVQPVGV